MLTFLKKHTYQNPERTFFVLTILTGVLSGMVAVGFHDLVVYLTHLFKTNEVFTAKTALYSGLLLLVSGLLTTRYFPNTSGSGIPLVRLSIAANSGKIRVVDTIMKFITSVLSLSSGLSVGREGPTVSITSGIGSMLGQLFHLPKRQLKTLVGIGSSGGLAAAFYTPIAAVVFTLEEIVGNLNATKMLGPIILSAVSASITAQILKDGDLYVFTELKYRLQDNKELFFYIAIGLSAALFGVLWVKTVIKLRSLNRKIFKRMKMIPIFIALAVTVGLSLHLPQVLGSGHETLQSVLLSTITDWKLLVLIFIAKFIATATSYSSGVSGGLFMPTLMMGAMVGSIIGALAQTLFPEVAGNLGAYALVGMGAMFVAVIRAPFTSIIMIFELTRDYNIILPLMVANIISWIVSSRLHPESVYESLSEQDGVHLPNKEDHDILESLVVENAMEKIDCLESDLLVKNFFEKVKENDNSAYPVLLNGAIVGIVSKNEIALALSKGSAEEQIGNIPLRNVVSVYPDQSLMVALHRLNHFQVSKLFVVSRMDHLKLIGVITAEDIVSQFGYHLKEEIEEVKEEIEALVD